MEGRGCDPTPGIGAHGAGGLAPVYGSLSHDPLRSAGARDIRAGRGGGVHHPVYRDREGAPGTASGISFRRGAGADRRAIEDLWLIKG